LDFVLSDDTRAVAQIISVHLLFPCTLVVFYHRNRGAVHIIGGMLGTMIVDRLSDLLGAASGGDIAFGT
jgi:hypothetical protein